MKKSLQITTFALALALVATPVFAEVDSSTDLRLDGPDKIETRINMGVDIRDDMFKKQEAVREMKGEVMEYKDDRLEMMKENKSELNEKFEAKREEMESLKSRIHDATTQEEREAIKIEAKTTRDEFKTEIKETRETNRAEIKAKTAEIKALRHEVIGKMYGAMIERLATLSDRVNSRLEKFAANGYDVSDAKAALSTANTEIALAKADFVQLSDIDDDTNKKLAESMKSHLRLAHDSLVKAVVALKANVSVETNQ